MGRVVPMLSLALILAVGVVLLTRGGDEPESVVHRIKIAALAEGGEPWCFEAERFCIIERSPGYYEALYMVDTDPEYRELGCSVRPHRELVATPASVAVPATPFRADCSGTTFDQTGERLTGPPARRLDRFAAFENDGYLLVNTRELICAETSCVLAPR